MKILRIQYATPITAQQLPFFRGAILKMVEHEDSTLFHNHIDDHYRYGYPLIQYKRIGGRAAIICVGEGTEAIGQYFANRQDDIRLGQEAITLEMDYVKAYNVNVQLWKTTFHYTLRRWLPLNQENYKLYQQTTSLQQRIDLLQRMLIGNILSMLKTMGIHLEEQLLCSITDMSQPRIVTYKGVKMMSFNINFTSNISLPDYIGLGKGASLGHGIVKQIKTTQEE